MHEYCLQFSWFAFCWKLKNEEFGHLQVISLLLLQDKGKNADEIKKRSVFETAEKEDVTVDIHIGYVGRSNNIIAVD